MKRLCLAAAALFVSACATAQTEDRDWRPVEAENLFLFELEAGEVAIELNPNFAPNHAARMRDLARAGVYDGERFYRVIEGFVAQGGVQQEERMTDWPNLENENDRPITEDGFVPLGNGDLFASEVGHIGGFAVGRHQGFEREWLLHCPGAMAMARDVDPDTGGTEFYIVLDAHRYLDRNLTVFGRVIDGFEHIQALPRGDRAVENGVIQPPALGGLIVSARMAADLPEEDRPAYEVMRTDSAAFEGHKIGLRVRENEFFYRKPPEVLDICAFSAPARKTG
ncbi:MAG: peptidylprolyl isomerase [Pseudomonadota bacterium]